MNAHRLNGQGFLRSLSPLAITIAVSLAAVGGLHAKGLPPKVAIVLPLEGTVFDAGADIHLVAQASDPDLGGFVRTVEFFAGDHSLGVTVNNPLIAGPINPFQLTWPRVAAGSYTLTAKATDELGLEAVSQPVHVTVGSHLDTQVVVGVDVEDWEASESGDRDFIDLAVFKVRRTGSTDFPLPVFYKIGGTAENGADYAKLTGELTIPAGADAARIVVQPLEDDLIEGNEIVVIELVPPPCVLIFPPPKECYRVGEHAAGRAVIHDADAPANLPPEVKIVLPESGASFHAGTDLFMLANAIDQDGRVETVEFFANDRSLGIAKWFATLNPIGPFFLTWHDAPAGEFALTARATDDQGATTISAAVKITVIPRPSLQVVSIHASSPFTSEPLPNADVAPGRFLLSRSGDAKNALTVFVTFEGTAKPGEDYKALDQFVTFPEGVISVHLDVLALDDELVEGDETVVAHLSEPPFDRLPDYIVDPSHHTAKVVIHDADAPANHPPSVKIVFLESGATFTAPAQIELVAFARDEEDGYDLTVEFFAGDRSLGLGTFNPTRCADICPNYILWWKEVPAGEYEVTARATDSAGLVAVSAGVKVIVKAGPTDLPPKVAVTQPKSGDVFAAHSDINFTVEASDPDGYIAQADLYAGDKLIATEQRAYLVAPPDGELATFHFVWKDAPAGEFKVWAKATDDSGTTGHSEAILVIVRAPTAVPFVSIAASQPETTEPSPTTRIIPGKFTLKRDPADGWLVVFLAYDGAATPGKDYEPLPRWVYFPDGASSVDLTVAPFDDELVEGDETVLARLLSGQPDNLPVEFPVRDYRVDPEHAEAKVVIHDNDAPSDHPVIHITAPKDGDWFVAPATIKIEATAIDPKGYLPRVEFFANGTLIGASEINFIVAPDPGTPIHHALEWKAVAAGQYELVAKGVTANGQAVVSASVKISVNEPPAEPLVLVKRGSVWKYLDDGSDQGGAWAEPGFDDAKWASGPAQLGYGDGDEATKVSFGPNAEQKFITTYFRHTFEVKGAAAVKALFVRLLRDDGAAGYLNGKPVFRSNLPDGPVNYKTLAASTVSEEDERRFLGIRIDPSLLVEGANVLAVEVHQASASSSDISFDLELVGGEPPQENQPPVVGIFKPRSGQTFLAPARIEIQAEAGDRDGSVKSVAFHAGDKLLGVDEGAPWALVWEDVGPGEYKLWAKATDNLGATGVSETVTIRVVERPPEQAVVTIEAVDPTAAETESRGEGPGEPNIAVFRLHRTGPTDFPIPVYLGFDGTARNGEDYLRVPEIVRIPEGASTADLRIVPIDDSRFEGTEAVLIRVHPPRCIEIVPPPRECYRVGDPSEAKAAIFDNDTEGANRPPKVELVHPRDGQSFPAYANILIVAHASDHDGKVVSVEFFANGQKLGDKTPLPAVSERAPWVFHWKNAPPGRYELTAKATDDDGASTISEIVHITVRGRPEHATLKLTTPENGATFRAPADITIRAVAVDPQGYIARVVFSANGREIGVSEIVFVRAPDPGTPIEHEFLWKGVPAGEYKLGARAKDNSGGTVEAQSVLIKVGPTPEPIFVERELPDRYTPGVKFVVLLKVRPPTGTQSHAVEDSPPRGWEVAGISHDGLFDRANGKVKFGPFLDAEPRELSYDVTPPADAQGRHEFSGIASADGVNSRIGGDRVIGASRQHPADRDPANWVMTVGEVTAYATAWRTGSEWPAPPNPIPISYVTRAGALWRGGENYTFEPSAGPPPLWWVNTPREGPSVESTFELGADPSLHLGLGTEDAEELKAANRAAVGAATREFSVGVEGAAGVVVTIRVAPATGVLTYAVEDALPNGWAAFDIDNEGAFETRTGRIKWGPFFDDTPRVLTYRVTPSVKGNFCAKFGAVASFDGLDVAITGVKKLRDDAVLNFSAAAGLSFRVEGSHDLQTWFQLGTVLSAEDQINFVDPESGNLPHRFYRLVPVR
jgi:hypothetical protein